MEKLYAERLNRYVTAMQNGKPDRVPIRPFVAEFIAKYAGYTCQEVTHDYQNAFDAVIKCAKDFDWDATVGNMVYVWSGLTEAIGIDYYGIPGIDVPPNHGFQYLEPPAGKEYMRADEYDQLIDDPTNFLFNTWLPRVARDVVPIGEPSTYRNNLSFLKGGMVMLKYFGDLGAQGARMQQEAGTVSAIAGIFKAPFDILADKLRGYVGLSQDLLEQPDKVLAAARAMMPHLCKVAMDSSDPDKNVPIGFWMHRGCVPFVSPEQFEKFYWPTLRPIIEELWSNGLQTLFYAEGDWNAHLDAFTELPDRSIVYHVDRGDIFEASRKLGHKFCISGGVPNFLLAYRKPEEVRDEVKRIIDGVAGDGGYILDASAIIQNDAKVENMIAMTEAGREYGVYSAAEQEKKQPATDRNDPNPPQMPDESRLKRKPGVCVPWEEKREDLSAISGDEALLQRVWEDVEQLAYTYIYHILVSF